MNETHESTESPSESQGIEAERKLNSGKLKEYIAANVPEGMHLSKDGTCYIGDGWIEVEPNETPEGKLPEYLIGDLGPARRHLMRIANGELPFSLSVLREMRNSIERCVQRINRDMKSDKSPSQVPNELNTPCTSGVSNNERFWPFGDGGGMS